MSSKEFDVVVIGGGPAGYPAAIRAAQNGLSTACIDEWQNHDGSRRFGGTCLNAGCIPSKALLESSELYHRAASEFKAHGIAVSELGMDVATMQSRFKLRGGPMMYLALTYDHRVVDGREAVQFLVALRELLEDPARLILQV